MIFYTTYKELATVLAYVMPTVCPFTVDQSIYILLYPTMIYFIFWSIYLKFFFILSRMLMLMSRKWIVLVVDLLVLGNVCDIFFNLTTLTAGSCFLIWKLFVAGNSEHSDVVQSVSWKRDGRLVITSCKDKQLRVIDPRSSKHQVTQSTSSHQSIKDSRVVWLGDSNRILTTGFDSVSIRGIQKVIITKLSYKIGFEMVFL